MKMLLEVIKSFFKGKINRAATAVEWKLKRCPLLKKKRPVLAAARIVKIVQAAADKSDGGSAAVA
jgi:hypothetical protein